MSQTVPSFNLWYCWGFAWPSAHYASHKWLEILLVISLSIKSYTISASEKFNSTCYSSSIFRIWHHYSEPCIRGHRATSCAHVDRVLIEVRKPGRPLQSCGHRLATCICGRLTQTFSEGESKFMLRNLSSCWVTNIWFSRYRPSKIKNPIRITTEAVQI